MNLDIRHPTDRPNFTIINIDGIGIAFSYQTVVGLSLPGEWGWKVCENIWSQTTGKHLNWLDDGNKATRLSHERFEELVDSIKVSARVNPSLLPQPETPVTEARVASPSVE